MFPLLRRDGLVIPYFAVNALFIALLVLLRESEKEEMMAAILFEVEEEMKEDNKDHNKRKESSDSSVTSWTRRLVNGCITLSFIGMLLLHVLEATAKPPKRYPDLFPAVFSIYGAVNLSVVLIVLYARLLAL